MAEEAKAEDKKSEEKSDKKETKKDASEKKMNPWLIVGVIAIIIILFYACRAPDEQIQSTVPGEQEEQPATPEEQGDVLLDEQPEQEIIETPEELSLTEVFASAEPAHCMFTFQGVEVEMYKDHEKFRQVAEQDGLEITTLHNEGIMYVWTSDGIGKKVDLRALARSGLMENIQDVPAQPSDEVMGAASDVECDDKVPAGIFTPSPYIQFQDMNVALEQAVKDAQENAAYTSVGYQRPTI